MEEDKKENNLLFIKQNKEFIERIKDTPIGGNVYKNYSDAWWWLDPNKPSRTVVISSLKLGKTWISSNKVVVFLVLSRNVLMESFYLSILEKMYAF